MESPEEVWAQLVSTTENLSDPVEIRKNKFVIGRSAVADLSLPGNKFISGKHCFIEKYDNGEVWLHDTSINGTVLNRKEKLLKNKALLHHGDEFHLVYQKTDPSFNVSYMFQDKKALLQEELSSSSEQTIDYEVRDCEATAEISEAVNPELDSGFDKKRKAESDNPNGNEVKKKLPKMETCDSHVEKMDEARKSEEKALKSEENFQEFEQNLTCIICQDIFHDCISCQPCMHSFCAGCYSEWMIQSQECPSCRGTVERVNKNYVINSLVEAYLKQHPEKKRSEEEIKALDSRNKILKDSMKVSKLKKTLSSLIDDNNDDTDSGSNNDIERTPDSTFFGSGNAYICLRQDGAPKTVCQQCPEYKHDSVLTDPVAGPSTSIRNDCQRSSTTIARYQCTPDQVHIMCQCCLKPMPDRRIAAQTDRTIPSQQCMFCYRIYCHEYWGCQARNCDGCIAQFKDLNFGPKCLPGLILHNTYESDIFKNYLNDKGIDIKEVVKDCLNKLDQGSYTCMDQARGLNSSSVVCYHCGLRNLQDLVYQYRNDIPNGDLPESVTRRPNCYWGKNCRTQKGKLHHAAKFNHICEQTRT